MFLKKHDHCWKDISRTDSQWAHISCFCLENWLGRNQKIIYSFKDSFLLANQTSVCKTIFIKTSKVQLNYKLHKKSEYKSVKNHFIENFYREYITCTACGWQHERSNDINQRVTNRHLARSREHFCQQCIRTVILPVKKDHLESDEQKITKKCCIVKPAKKINYSNPSQIKSTAPSKKISTLEKLTNTLIESLYLMI